MIKKIFKTKSKTNAGRRAGAAFAGAIASVAALAADAQASGAEEATREAMIVASITYNFARFLQWDSAAAEDEAGSLVLCVVDGDASPAWRNIDGKRVGARAIEVVYSRDGAIAGAGCKLAYFSDELLKSVSLKEVADAGVVTISDSWRFLKSGGAIQLVVADNRATFDVNTRTLNRAGARVSSKLMRVGMKVSVSEN